MTLADPELIENECTAYDRYKRFAEKKLKGFSLDENGHVTKGGYCYGWVIGRDGLWRVPSIKARKFNPPYISKKPIDFNPNI